MKTLILMMLLNNPIDGVVPPQDAIDLDIDDSERIELIKEYCQKFTDPKVCLRYLGVIDD